ncbi:uncharacterized protein BDV17DRAFT_16319 [Aspergillus undulatus]|uniref:uncharacterized protein n=1 Tax=Aspergillus undulatus TaxID=1810928 RepID=UPI003CCE081D
MSLTQISVAEHDCYVLFSDGSIKLYHPGTNEWRIAITANPENVQITGTNPLGVRQKNGAVYRVNRNNIVHNLGTNATLLWSHKGTFWQWQKGNANLYCMGYETGGRWQVRNTNPHLKDLTFTQDGVYELGVAGQIARYQAPGKWVTVDSSYSNTAIAADDEALYALKRDGKVYRFVEGNWQGIGGTKALHIAAGEAGLFALRDDAMIYQYEGTGSAWKLVNQNIDTLSIAVASSAYRVNNRGEIFILRDNGVWNRIKEEDPHPAPPTPGGVQPEKVYNGGYTNASAIRLRIGNGGAGQTGLVEALANAYIKSRVAKGAEPFQVAWYKSDTTESINYLKDGVADVAITYTEAAEELAIEHGIALSPCHYIFREHFLLTGPPSNPAKLNPNDDILHQISTLYTAADAGNTDPPVRFLSRYDKSATSIKDSELWIKIGQVPWAMKYSNWYHQYMAYPIQALTAAAALQEYTLTDWGTYLSVDDSVRSQLTVYKHGLDDPRDLLLMPAHLLVGAKAQDLDLAKDFAAWATGTEGQAVIRGFVKRGEQVYSTAP